MSIIDEIVARFEAQASDTFLIIERVAQMADVKALPPVTPALYIYVIEEAAKENERISEVYQRVEMDIGFMIITSNVGDLKSGKASGDVEPLKAKVDSVVLGWQPPSAAEPIEYIGGRLAKANAGSVWWEHTNGTAFYKKGEAA